jgi:hypothetical protein
LYQAAVLLDVLLSKVAFEASAFADQFQKSTAGMEVFFVCAQVIRDLFDARG